MADHPPSPPSPGIEETLKGPIRPTFEALKASGIQYVVLRGYDPLSEVSESLDVDIFMPAGELLRAIPLLKEAGWRRRRHQVGRHPHVFFDSWASEGPLVRSLDVVTDLHYGENLYQLRNAASVIETGEWKDCVRIPNPWMALLTFALHVILDKGRLSEANHKRAEQMLKEAGKRPGDRGKLERTFGSKAVHLVDAFQTLVHDSSQSQLASLAGEARSLECLRPHRGLALADSVRKWATNLRRPVVRVAFHGPDGSGKSSLISALQRDQGALRIHSAYMGHNLFRTPPAKWLQERLGRGIVEDRTETISYRIVANLHDLWFPFELLARMLLAEHRASLVTYDRFPFDDDQGSPSTLFGRFMAAYRAFGRSLIPRPDLTILLDGDPRTIWDRKREYSFETHLESRRAYRELHESLPTEQGTVRTDQDLDESLAALKGILAESPAVRKKLYDS